jgi:hypothetical protein
MERFLAVLPPALACLATAARAGTGKASPTGFIASLHDGPRGLLLALQVVQRIAPEIATVYLTAQQH